MGMMKRLFGHLVDADIESMRMILNSLPPGTEWAAIADVAFLDIDRKMVKENGVLHCDGIHIGFVRWNGSRVVTAKLRRLDISVRKSDLWFTQDRTQYVFENVHSLGDVILDAPAFAQSIDRNEPFRALQETILNGTIIGGRAWTTFDLS